MGETTIRIAMPEAVSLIAAAFAANGVVEDRAESVARALVTAEAEGQKGHGFSRLDDYVAQVRSGKIVADAPITVTETSETGLIIDAGYGFAYPALDVAAERGGRLALQKGTATIAVARSHHCGALSVQVDRLARQGLVALMFANAPAAIAPWGAGRPIYGTNPIAFAVPRSDAPPLVIDLSLSRVARGKVMAARKAGTSIPLGWAVDASGAPTTDPEAALGGAMLPIGEAKGTSLALMVEILAAVMTGSTLSAHASSFFEAEGPSPGVGQFLIAFRPSDAGFAERLEGLLSLVEAQEGARLPGQRRLAALEDAERGGIEVPERYIKLARELAGRG